MRQALPLRSPRPPPISMPNCVSSRWCRRRVVHAGQDAHRVELRQLATLDGGVLQAERVQSGLERPVVAQVPRPARLQPLLMDETQSLPQGVDHADRRRVVVAVFLVPVVLDHRDVEIPALHLGLAPLDRLQGPWTRTSPATDRVGSSALSASSLRRLRPDPRRPPPAAHSRAT